MLELAAVKTSDVVYDLGSGDGRIVITAAKKYGCKTVGYEIDKELVELSHERVKEAGVEQRVNIEHKDIFTVDVSRADVIAVYLLPKQLEALIPQLEKLKPGSRIVSHQFEIPGVKPNKTIEVKSAKDGDRHTIHLWMAPLVIPK
jgi:cyclopropane fatty-acyl-phospholipid synthase-like methyltransferase